MKVSIYSINLGIPVSQGVAKGFVRKALTLEEASDIKVSYKGKSY